MRLLVLNPNTTQAMTDAVSAQIRALAGPAVCVEGLTAAAGCAVIDSAQSFAIGAAAALDSLQHYLRISAEKADGILLACFGDPGLHGLRAISPVPVRALAEAAIEAALASPGKFAILTCGPQWVPLLDACVEACGATARYAGCLALPVNGAALLREPAAYAPALLALSRAAADAGAAQLIMGGAAFAGLQIEIDPRLRRIDPVAAATQALLAPRA
ncbi:aspartate/glutamate racemase family protein [Uliginosibacterium sediminicola]|uniref:Aspartate/glutamate racemase family protein n=1 Tax=Uliginosibacterium sediminicola TaxID=2024550 RepID=A0ABU9YVD7_9RHOO